jgi:hypothetical protein
MLGEHPNVGVNTLEVNIGVTLLFIDLGGERRLDMLDFDSQCLLDSTDVRPQRIDDFSGFDVHENLP